MRLHAVLRRTHEGAELLVLGSDNALAPEAQAPLMNALIAAVSLGCACEPSCTHSCDEISEANHKAALAVPECSSEHAERALEQASARRKRLVEWWYEPGALQRMLRAISNDLNVRDRQASDRHTTASAEDKRPRRPKSSKTRGAA